ncbi:hypothetical protein DSECCO2_152120 [anaerobic digester metagenome]
MKALKKLGGQKGFSLFESMVALFIISILTVGITTAVNAAANVYKKSLFVSEGEVLAATIDIALSDLLRFSSDITEEDGIVEFTNTGYNVKKGHLFLDSGLLYINLTEEKPDDAIDAPLATLINLGVYSSMKIKEGSFKLNYVEGVFSGNYVIQSKDDSTLEKNYEFFFRTVN